jgi:hypothetical protein
MRGFFVFAFAVTVMTSAISCDNPTDNGSKDKIVLGR